MKLLKFCTPLIFVACLLISTAFSQSTGNLNGTISDSLGGVVPGVIVTIFDANGNQRKTVTNKQGVFVFKGVTVGKYTLKVSAPKFSPFEQTEIEIKSGEKSEIAVVLNIAPIQTEVEINSRKEISTDADSSVSQVVLNEEEIENLPDNPEELEAYLQAMAGGAEGMDGGQFYIDGITSGRMPPKSSIREIRINRSPFSAENERAGFGGIEIFTKPGTDKFRGSGNFNFNDARLNSRNPFALIRPPSQTRNFGGSFSGPIKKKVSSFFVDYNTSQQDNSRIINASILDASLNIISFQEDITVPSRSSSFGARIDYQLNKNNIMSVRYGFSHNKSENQGVSDFSLPTRAFQTSGRNHSFSFSESMIINSETVNETIFGLNISQREQEGDNSAPTINVSGAFMGGGSQVGFNYNDSKRWEIQNNTTTLFGKNGQHAVKFGVRVRGISIEDRSESNFGGMFTFAGVRDASTGALLFSSIEQYRQKILGNPDPRFNPNQFSITGGNALAEISQTDLGIFITDEWRVRGNLTLSFGVRYEDQTNIKDYNDFAPRFGFAFAPDAQKGKPAKTVLRGGFGIFYNRLSESFFMQARRFNGTQQTQYIVSGNADVLGKPVFTLNNVTNVPSITDLSAFARQNSVTVRRVSEELVSPLAYQLAFSVDRQLPLKTKVAVTYNHTQGFSQLGIRNINAPICPPLQACLSTTPRPNPAEGNVYFYESIGEMNQRQIVVNFNSNAFKGFNLSGNYRLGFSKSNLDGSGSFPFYSYDLSLDYGVSSQDIRHSFSFNSSFQLPFKIRLSPSVNLSSGRPFNITSGVDTNRDSIFNDRPTYAQLNSTCQKLGLTNDFCNNEGIDNPAATIIPRNYGRGPGFFNMNLSLNRSFVLKKEKTGGYNLAIGVQISNLLNHVNQSAPIGNLSSNRFGQTFSTMNFFGGGANRRIDLSVRFNF